MGNTDKFEMMANIYNAAILIFMGQDASLFILDSQK